MLQPTSITLKYTTENLRELYFANGGGKIWNHWYFRRTMTQITLALFAVLVFNALTALLNAPVLLIGAILAILVAIGVSMIMIKQVWNFFRWKRAVNALIRNLSGTSETIGWTEAGFIYTITDETKFVEWDAVKQVRIFPAYISLMAGEDQHILPSRAMEPGDYENFCSVLKHAVIGEIVHNYVR